MNDNRALRRPTRRPRLVLIEGGIAPEPRRCFCGDFPTVDRACDFTGRNVLFVVCDSCGAEGARERTHDLAVAAWNRLTAMPPRGTP